jgi:hypothetical protein
MTDWRTRLRDADRALERDVEPEVSQRIRRTVLAAVPARPAAVQAWSRTFAATAAALTLVSVALLTTLQGGARLADDTAVRVEPADPALAATTDDTPATERQQLHFSTPGGTRIIWVFDPGFEVKGTLP